MEEETKTVETAGAKKEETPFVIAGSILLAGVLVAGAIMYSTGPGLPKQPAAVASPEVLTLNNEQLAANSASMGNPEAPVTIVEFSDFQCPYCNKFFQTAEKDIIEKYVKTGQVRFVYRHFPLTNIHPNALPAAQASEAARIQGKFWEMHNLLFVRQTEWSNLPNPNNTFVSYAQNLGLDTAKFAKDMDSQEIKNIISKDMADAAMLEIDGTPTNFINGERLVGAIPFLQSEAEAMRLPKGFQTIIEDALRAKK